VTGFTLLEGKTVGSQSPCAFERYEAHSMLEVRGMREDVSRPVTQMDERAAPLRWALVGRMRRVATMSLHAPGACRQSAPFSNFNQIPPRRCYGSYAPRHALGALGESSAGIVGQNVACFIAWRMAA
jgi:hypothetical protein